MKSTVPYVHDIGDYDRNPDVYQKVDYDPFGNGSETWKIFYFELKKIVRKKVRYRAYQSYGRDTFTAKLGLIRAIKNSDVTNITRQRYNTIKRANKKRKHQREC